MAGPQAGKAAARDCVVGWHGLWSENEIKDLRCSLQRTGDGRRLRDEPAPPGLRDVQRGEGRRDLAAVMRVGREQRQSQIACGCSMAIGQRHRAAQRMADQQRPLQPQPLDQPDDDARLLAKARAGARRPHRIAGPRPVERDQAVIAGELVEQRMAELMELGAQPMDEDDRPPLPRFGIVDAVAVDVDELAGWRHLLLGVARRSCAWRRRNSRRPAPCRSPGPREPTKR